jgi:hypothetical protein
MDYLSSLLTMDALADSVHTVFLQHDDIHESSSRNGFTYPGWIEREQQTLGARRMILNHFEQMAGSLSAWRRNPVWSLQPIADIVQTARAHGIHLVVIIAPSRIELLALRNLLDIQPMVDRWRHDLAEVVSAAGASSDENQIALWDFETPTIHTTESLPPETDRTARLRWFWDNLHPRPELGSLMIQQIVAADGTPGPGRRVTTANWQDVNRTIDEGVADWEANHPVERAELEALVAKMRQGHEQGAGAAWPEPN